MITTTVYTTRETMTTDDNGNITRHTTRTAHTYSECLFRELSPAAQEVAIAEAIEQETDERNWYASHTCNAEEKIWFAVHEFEKRQPVRFYTDLGGSVCAEERAPYCYDAWERVTTAKEAGDTYSMDIAAAWNRYAPRIMALAAAYDEAAYAMNDADDEKTADHYEALTSRISDAAEGLTEDAARAVGDVVESLIEAEREMCGLSLYDVAHELGVAVNTV